MNDLILSVEQRQVLSQRTIQNIEILQMDAVSLESYLEEIALSNPVMEPAPAEPAESRFRVVARDSSYPTPGTAAPDAGANPLEQLAAQMENDLTDTLLFQLIPYFQSKLDKAVFYFLVNSLDENGFLTVSAQELCTFYPIQLQQAEHYIALLRSLEPTGIGAANLQECLTLQLQKSSDRNAPLAIRLLNEQMDLVASNQVRELARLFAVSTGQISGALQLIRSLNPRPAGGFARRETPAYVVPDLIITREEDAFQIVLNGDLVHNFHISSSYRSLLDHPDPEVQKYLLEKYQQAEWISHCIQRRNQTLLQVAAKLLEYQQDFFLKGPGHLHPLSQSDLSRQLELNDSTISRAIHAKYLECAWGVYPLKYFFSRTAANDAEHTVAQLKERISALIAAEDKRHPLSDQKIADLLARDHITIARRTVAKYRAELNIPDTSKRRTF